MSDESSGAIDRLKKLPAVRAGSVYAATAFVIVQVVGLISDSFGFPESVMQSVIWVSVAGLPVVIAMSMMISAHVSTLKLLLMTLGLMAVGYFGWAFYLIQYVMSPQLEDAVSQDDYTKSWIIAREMDQTLPFIPEIREALETLGRSAVINIKQDGVDVYWKPYASEEFTWEFLGTSPLVEKPLPVGHLQLRLEKAGYRTAYLSFSNPSPSFRNFPVELAVDFSPLELAKEESVPEGMIFVPGGPFLPAITGETPQNHVLSPFYIDEMEVSNKQFKAFIDAGGYESPSYWQGMEFVKDGVTLDYSKAAIVYGGSNRSQRPRRLGTGRLPRRAR